ncbi:MAG: TonB family protein [Verrucomicrobiae bacterium]|nr:TonB family protein [Verrucomicrobiae bacterium]
MEPRFKNNLILVTAIHVVAVVALFILASSYFHKPAVPEKITWVPLPKGDLNVKGSSKGTAPQGDLAPKQKIIGPRVADPRPNPPQPKPPKPVAPVPEPAPEPRPITPKPVAEPSRPNAVSDINIAPPKPTTSKVIKSTKVVTQSSEPKNTGTPVKPSKGIVKSSRVVAATSQGSSESTDAPGASGGGTGDRTNQEGEPNGLENLATRIKGSGGVKSGLPQGISLGASGSPSGTGESDFSGYFMHIKNSMTEAWDQPTALLTGGKTLRSGIRLSIARNGAITGASLSRSSGNSQWDQSALDAAKKVARLNPLPDGLGDAGGFTVVVYFEPEK